MLKAPAEALPSTRSCTPTRGRQHPTALRTPRRRRSGGWAAQEVTGFRVCSHPWGMGPSPPHPATLPAHRDDGGAGGSAPVQGGGCNVHPCNIPTGPAAPPVPPLLGRDLARPGQHISPVPQAMRWAQSILTRQHLAPEASLSPQPRGGGNSEVLQAAWASHAPATQQQVPGVPGCAPGLAVGCSCARASSLSLEAQRSTCM